MARVAVRWAQCAWMWSAPHRGDPGGPPTSPRPRPARSRWPGDGAGCGASPRMPRRFPPAPGQARRPSRRRPRRRPAATRVRVTSARRVAMQHGIPDHSRHDQHVMSRREQGVDLGTTNVSPSPNGRRWVTYTIFMATRSRAGVGPHQQARGRGPSAGWRHSSRRWRHGRGDREPVPAGVKGHGRWQERAQRQHDQRRRRVDQAADGAVTRPHEPARSTPPRWRCRSRTAGRPPAWGSRDACR